MPKKKVKVPAVKPKPSALVGDAAPEVSPEVLEIEGHLLNDEIVRIQELPDRGEAWRRNRELRSRRPAPKTDLEKAKQLFEDAELGFPTIPVELAAHFKELGPWLFSTRPVDVWPYLLKDYVDEVEKTQLKDYALLAHSGYGSESYVILYYLVHGPLRMFFHHGWGGARGDAEADAAKIRDCFSVLNQVVAAAQRVGRLQAGERLTVVASEFYGGYWVPPGEHRQWKDELWNHRKPLQVLAEALEWLTNYPEANL